MKLWLLATSISITNAAWNETYHLNSSDRSARQMVELSWPLFRSSSSQLDIRCYAKIVTSLQLVHAKGSLRAKIYTKKIRFFTLFYSRGIYVLSTEGKEWMETSISAIYSTSSSSQLHRHSHPHILFLIWADVINQILIRYPLAIERSEYKQNVCIIKRFFVNASVFFFSSTRNPTTFSLFFSQVDNGEGSKCGVISYRYPKPWLLDYSKGAGQHFRRCKRKNRGKFDWKNNTAILATDNVKFGMLTISELVILAVIWRFYFGPSFRRWSLICAGRSRVQRIHTSSRLTIHDMVFGCMAEKVKSKLWDDHGVDLIAWSRIEALWHSWLYLPLIRRAATLCYPLMRFMLISIRSDWQKRTHMPSSQYLGTCVIIYMLLLVENFYDLISTLFINRPIFLPIHLCICLHASSFIYPCIYSCISVSTTF